MKKVGSTLLLMIFLIAISSALVAQASSNDRPSLRGEGAGGLSGYRVSSLHFLLSDKPGEVKQVEFDLDAPANKVQVSFGSQAGGTFPCQQITGKHWHCPLAGVEVGGIDQIWVTAVGS